MRRYWQYIILVLISLFVAWQTYTPGTWQSGWDVLHPEFDFSLAFERQLSGVWREDQGLGTVAIHSHMADLPRTALLALAGLVVPTELLRYLALWAALVLGPIGVAVLLGYLTKGKKLSGLAALVAGIVYLFNLSTVQQLYVPFEMFTVQFALIGWLWWTASKFLQEGGRKNLAVYAMVMILIAPAAYAATLWYVMFGMVTIYAVTYGFIDKKIWRRVVRVIGVGLGVNLFWILPSLYALKNASYVKESMINRLFSPEAWFANWEYGGWIDVVQLKSFLWSWLSWDRESGKFGLLMGDWVNYIEDKWVVIAAGGVFVAGMVGLLASLLTKRAKKKRGLEIGILVVTLVSLLGISRVGVWGEFVEFIGGHSSLIKEIFRTAYTKFSIVLQMGIAVGAGMLVVRFGRYKVIGFVVGILMMVWAGIAGYPAIRGKLLSEVVKNKIPEVYFALFNKTKELESGRVALLPAPRLYGWEYNNWGYQGAGFLQFGVPQPLLTRDYDRWSPHNEGFYQELSTALYNIPTGEQTNELTEEGVRGVLDKYDVRYVLLDESVIAPGQGKEILRIEETKRLADERRWIEAWHEGFLTVWETPYGQHDQFVSAPESYALAKGDTLKTRRDVIWEENGTYVSDFGGVDYPFADLRRESVGDREIVYGEGRFEISKEVPQFDSATVSQLLVPGFEKREEVEVSYKLSISDGMLELKWEPAYRVNGEEGPKIANDQWPMDDGQKRVWVKVGADKENAIYLEEGQEMKGQVQLAVGEDIEVKIYDGVVEKSDDLSELFVPGNLQTCWKSDTGEPITKIDEISEGLRLWTKNAAACLPMPLPASTEDELLQTVLYHRSGDGVRPQICLDEVNEPYECVNEEVWGREGASAEWSYVMRAVVAKSGEQYWLDTSAKPVEPSSTLRSIDYQMPIVNRYPLIEESVIADGWESYLTEQKFSLQGPTPHGDYSLKVEIPGEPKRYDLAEIGRVEAFNCDALERGEVDKSRDVYTADRYGANCDYMELSGLDTQMGYLMRLTGENRQGRSMKLFLHNTASGRNDLEYLLDEDRWDQTFTILPWELQGRYVLNTEVRSFGQTSENMIYPIEVRYLPLTQLARSRIGQAEKVINNLKIGEVKKTGTWLYRVRTEGEGLLTLSQGFDEGWVGVRWPMANGQWLMAEHVMVDGWKNGWFVDGQIIIFYWPQLLQYAGFVILIVTIGWVVKRPKNKLA